MVEASWPTNRYPSPHSSSSRLNPQSSHISLWTRKAGTRPFSSGKATTTGFPQPVLPSETRWLFLYTRGTSPLTYIWARRPILYLRVWWHLLCSTSTPTFTLSYRPWSRLGLFTRLTSAYGRLSSEVWTDRCATKPDRPIHGRLPAKPISGIWPGDFGYVYSSKGGASTSFGPGAQEEGDDDE